MSHKRGHDNLSYVVSRSEQYVFSFLCKRLGGIDYCCLFLKFIKIRNIEIGKEFLEFIATCALFRRIK